VLGFRGPCDKRWSKAIAIGSLTFVDKVKSELGFKAAHRKVTDVTGVYTLREEGEAYGPNFAGEKEVLRPENTMFWDENAGIT
jgi:REP-associated tyrosine transposase